MTEAMFNECAITGPKFQSVHHVDRTTRERPIYSGCFQDHQFLSEIANPRTVGEFLVIDCDIIYERKPRQNRALGEVVGTQIAHGKLHIKGAGHIVGGTRNPAVDVEDSYLQD